MTAFELRIWPGPGASPGSTSSSPVGTIATRGRGTTLTAAAADRRQHPQPSRPQDRPARHDHVAGAHLRPAPQHVLAGPDSALLDDHDPIEQSRPLVHHDRVATRRNRSAGHDRRPPRAGPEPAMGVRPAVIDFAQPQASGPAPPDRLTAPRSRRRAPCRTGASRRRRCTSSASAHPSAVFEPAATAGASARAMLQHRGKRLGDGQHGDTRPAMARAS